MIIFDSAVIDVYLIRNTLAIFIEDCYFGKRGVYYLCQIGVCTYAHEYFVKCIIQCLHSKLTDAIVLLNCYPLLVMDIYCEILMIEVTKTRMNCPTVDQMTNKFDFGSQKNDPLEICGK